MIGFIKKDLLLVKNNLKSIIILLFIYVFMAINGNLDISFFIPYLSVIMFISTFSYDEYNHFDAYAISLPKGKNNIIKAKYITSLIIAFISIILVLILSIGISYYKNNLDIVEILNTSLIVMTSSVVLISFIFPFILKYGIEVGRYILLTLVVIFVVSIEIISKKIKLNLSSLESILNNYWFIILPIVSIIILYTSFKISKKIYNKKEF